MTDEPKTPQDPVAAGSACSAGLGRGMSFKEALQKLNIEDYGERIFHSNSHGELFYVYDYIQIAKAFEGSNMEWFRPWFEAVVKGAEEQWQRPESVFQHIPRLLRETLGSKA